MAWYRDDHKTAENSLPIERHKPLPRYDVSLYKIKFKRNLTINVLIIMQVSNMSIQNSTLITYNLDGYATQKFLCCCWRWHLALTKIFRGVWSKPANVVFIQQPLKQGIGHAVGCRGRGNPQLKVGGAFGNLFGSDNVFAPPNSKWQYHRPM
jgi:hypothetical protein